MPHLEKERVRHGEIADETSLTFSSSHGFTRTRVSKMPRNSDEASVSVAETRGSSSPVPAAPGQHVVPTRPISAEQIWDAERPPQSVKHGGRTQPDRDLQQVLQERGIAARQELHDLHPNSDREGSQAATHHAEGLQRVRFREGGDGFLADGAHGARDRWMWSQLDHVS